MPNLIDAGAPELPDGFFYRVREGALYLHLEIRKSRRLIGSRLVISRVVREPFFTTPLKAIVDACRCARAGLDMVATRAAYLGDHHTRRTK